MDLVIKAAEKLQGEITIPGDKSISHRAVILGSLAKGEMVVTNFLPSADCLATVECFRKMGVEIQMTNAECLMPNEGKIIIKGKGLYGLEKPREILYVGNSGTTIRLLSGVLAGQSFETTITGDESIQRRPMRRIADPLMLMGSKVEGRRSKDEIYPPLKISGGKLSAIEYLLPVPSAQVKSAILLAGLYVEGETVVTETIASRDHTERMLEYLGARVKRQGSRISIEGKHEFKGAEIEVPGDLSSAAFFMVAGAVMPNAECLMPNVGLNPTRTGIIDVLHRMGANLGVKDEQIICEEPRGNILIKTSRLKGIKISGEIIPKIIDEIPIIVVAATQAEGITEIRGAKELRVKESDRIATMTSELKKLGAKITELEDGMIIEGPTKLKGATVKSYGDHRVAMALAIAGLVADGETVVEDVECIETSFPGFSKLLYTLTSA